MTDDQSSTGFCLHGLNAAWLPEYGWYRLDPRGNREWAPYVIGLALGLGVLVMAPVTGAALNPARAFGPLLVGDFGSFDMFLVSYVIGPILGALAAAALYTVIVLKPQERVEQRPIDTLS